MNSDKALIRIINEKLKMYKGTYNYILRDHTLDRHGIDAQDVDEVRYKIEALEEVLNDVKEIGAFR